MSMLPVAYLRNLSPTRRAMLNTLAIGLSVQGIIVISGVLAARMLGPEGRGHLALYALIAAILVEIGGLGLPTAMTYQIAKDPAQARAITRVLGPIIGGQVALLFVIQAALIEVLFSGSNHDVFAAAVVSLAVVPSFLMQRYSMAILQGQQRFMWFNVIRIAQPAIYSASLVALFFVGPQTLLAVTIGFTMSNVVIGLLALGVTLRGLPVNHHTSRISRSSTLRFGVKGMLGASNPIETFNLDQAIVGLALSPADLGLYVVGVAFTNLPGFIAKSVGIVAYPQVASQTTASNVRRATWRYFRLNLILGFLVIAVLEILSGWLVPLFFGNQFRGAVPITRILLVSAFFLACRRVLSDGLRGANFPGLGSVAELAGWFVLLPLLPLFATWGGAQGVAFALVIASVFALLLLMVVARKQLNAAVSDAALQASLVAAASVPTDGSLPRPDGHARQPDAGTVAG